MPQSRTPKYRLHRPSGQAVVTLNGRDHYLGRHGTAASQRTYDEVIGRWLAGGRRLPEDHKRESLTISELLLGFYRYAEQCYGHRRTAGKRLSQVRCVLAPLRKLYGSTLAASFRPRDLLVLREWYIGLGWSRRTVNESLQIIKRMFRWAVREEIIAGSVWQELCAVPGLRSGESQAREPRKVQPVTDDFVDSVKPFISRQVWGMVELQRLTGMRPGEVVIMRGRDLDMTGEVWIYRPESHKTQHHGYERTVELGRRAQHIIKTFLKSDLEAFLFSPADAVAERRASAHAQRKTPMKHGNRPGKNRKRTPKRIPRNRYDTNTYRQAIWRACDTAFPPTGTLAKGNGESVKHWLERLTDEERQQLRTWRREHRWHPHQLRHSFATRIRRQFGVEAARILLGHRSAAVTEL